MAKKKSEKSIYSNWTVFSFLVKIRKKRKRVTVFAPGLEQAQAGCGLFDDDAPVLEKMSDMDREMRKLTMRKSIKQDELAVFYRSVFRFLDTGAPVQEALKVASGALKSPMMKGVIGDIIVAVVKDGVSLADAVGRHGEVFGEVAVSLMRAGEQSGRYDIIFERLATTAEKGNILMKKIVSGMAYPVFLLLVVFSALVGVIYMLFPTTKKTFDSLNANMPRWLEIAMDVGGWITDRPWLLGLPFLLVFLLFASRKMIANSLWFQRLSVRLPIVGGILRETVIVRSLQALALLMGNGANVLEAFRLTERVAGHHEYQKYFRRICERIGAGEQPHRAFAAERRTIPGDNGDDIAQQMRVAAYSGRTDQILSDLAAKLEEELQIKAAQLPKLMEPFMIGAVAVGVLCLVAVVVFPQFYLVIDVLKNSGK
jgi:type IV pilus assembly protein PilC